MTPVGTVLAWIVSQIPYGTATMQSICGTGLQEMVWSDLATNGPATVHRLIERCDDDHEKVRNALYRLLMRGAVRPIAREPAPRPSANRRVVWAAVHRDGTVVIARGNLKQWI